MAFIYDSHAILDIVKAALTLPRVEKLSWNKKERISTRSIPLDYKGEIRLLIKRWSHIFHHSNHIYMQPNNYEQSDSSTGTNTHHVNTLGGKNDQTEV